VNVTIWLAVLSTAVAMTLAAIIWHHVWEAHRDERALNRHADLMAAIEDQRRLTLGAIAHRNGLQETVQDLSTRLERVEAWRGLVEEWRSALGTRRP
jgi:hypothetical protein